MTSVGLFFMPNDLQTVSISAGDLSSQLKKSKWLTAAINKSVAKEPSRNANIFAGNVAGIFNHLFVIVASAELNEKYKIALP
jgi:hypothetical protein